MGMTDLDYVQGFARLCDDGFKQGWHERNGGNLTYRMTDGETESARPFFDAEPRPWVKMGVCAPKMGGKFFMAKGTGCYMRNMLGDIEGNAGIIEMSFIVPLEDREFTRKLWQMMTECVVVFPEGVGVVPWMVPGGPAIADATSEKMKSYRTAVWAHHGLFATVAILTRPSVLPTRLKRPRSSMSPRVRPTAVPMIS